MEDYQIAHLIDSIENRVNERLYKLSDRFVLIENVYDEVKKNSQIIEFLDTQIKSIMSNTVTNNVSLTSVLNDHSNLKQDFVQSIELLINRSKIMEGILNSVSNDQKSQETRISSIESKISCIENIKNNIENLGQCIIDFDLKLDILKSYVNDMVSENIKKHQAANKQIFDNKDLANMAKICSESAVESLQCLEDKQKRDCDMLILMNSNSFKLIGKSLEDLSKKFEGNFSDVLDLIKSIKDNDRQDKILDDIEFIRMDAANSIKRSINADTRLSLLERKLENVLLTVKQYELSR